MSHKVEVGDENHIRGFILSKLYTHGRLGRKSKGKCNKHTAVANLTKGYPREHLRKFPKIIKKMSSNKEQLIIIVSATTDKHVCANLDQKERGLVLCNMYREAAGLPPLEF